MSIDVQWIPRDSNTQADYVSKLCDFDDWCVSHEFFEFMNSFWGPHSIDRFASYLNAHLPRFNSLFWNPGCRCIYTILGSGKQLASSPLSSELFVTYGTVTLELHL